MDHSPGLGIRHVQAALIFVGLTIAYGLRVNLSVGIVAMTDNSSNPDFSTVDWSASEQGTILGSFFWGYMWTQIPAGQLAASMGASKPLGLAMVLNGLSTLIIPVAAIWGGFYVMCAARVIQGLGQGFVYPCVNTLMSKWAVPQERGRMYAWVFGGTQFGTIIMLVSGGFLAAGSGGWPSIFYVSGALSVAWGILCLIFVADSPGKHRSISTEEREYIERNLTSAVDNVKRPDTPWLEIATSVPLLALLFVHMSQNWGFWTLLTMMPTYISKVYNFNIKQNGLLSALPYFAMWMTSFVFSAIADILIKKNVFSPGVSRKFWNSVALYGGAVALLLLAVLDPGVVGAITCLTIAVGLNSATYCGYLCNHLDLSPNFAGTLMGITNGLSNITSILAPSIAGVILTQENDVGEWRTIFLIAAAISAIGETVFNIFGSGEVQPWNEGPKKKRNIQTEKPVASPEQNECTSNI